MTSATTDTMTPDIRNAMMPNSPELEAALIAVRSASEVCRSVQQNLVQAKTLEKGDKSPVTVADFASQAVVAQVLRTRFPEVPMVGEEDAAELRTGRHAALADAVAQHAKLDRETALAAIDHGGFDPNTSPGITRYWTLDPIDGTKGFLRGEQYAIALALIEEGQVVLGVLGCPNLDGGLTLAATRGGGTWSVGDGTQTPERFSVTSHDDPADARFCESVESGHSDQDASGDIASALGITAEPYRIDSQCKYAAVARGNADIYLRLPTRPGYQEKIWDHAAGMLAVQEAGGTVTDIHGNALDYSHGRVFAANQGVVATNGKLHDRVIAAVKANFTPPQ